MKLWLFVLPIFLNQLQSSEGRMAGQCQQVAAPTILQRWGIVQL